MEVHRHSHSEKKKNWKSSVWEFFMLFLAVFCGFLAEYQLEHLIEHKREKQYIESMIDDIKEDTAKLNSSLAYNIRKLSALDSFLTVIYKVPYTDSSIKLMYYYFRKYTGVRNDVAFTKRTLTQLKYSGGLRLIRNKAASDIIVRYDEKAAAIERQGDVYIYNYQGKAREFANKIFDSKYMLNYDRYNIDSLLRTNSKLKLISDDQALIKEYANWIYWGSAVLRIYISMLQAHQERALETIQFLSKEYKIQ